MEGRETMRFSIIMLHSKTNQHTFCSVTFIRFHVLKLLPGFRFNLRPVQLWENYLVTLQHSDTISFHAFFKLSALCLQALNMVLELRHAGLLLAKP